jgi:hypothetical protein
MLTAPVDSERDNPATKRLRTERTAGKWWLLPLSVLTIAVALVLLELAFIGARLSLAKGDLLAGRFQSALSGFSSARGDLRGNPLILPVRILPGAGRQLDALGYLADMGANASSAGAMAVNAAHTRDLGQLGALEKEVSIIQADRARIPDRGLVGPIRSAVTEFDVRFASAKELLYALPVLKKIVAIDGTQSYLVLQQDPAELRATGGFIGSIAYLDFNHGKMSPYHPIDIEQVDGTHYHRTLGMEGSPKWVRPPQPFFRVLDPGDSWELRDENFSPDFPTTAKTAEFLLQRETGKQVRGVIAVDPYLIAELLKVTGAVRVPETGDVLTTQNFFEVTLKRVELHRGTDPRKSFLSYATSAVVRQMERLPARSWLQLPTILREGCAAKDVQAYFDDPAAEALVQHFGCTGQVPTLKRDGLMVVDENLNSNKDDFWITRSFSLDLRRNGDGTVRHTLRIDYGAFPKLQQLTTPYIDWLRVYVPTGARLVSAQGIDQAATSSELDNGVIQGWLEFFYDQKASVTIVYDVPQSAMQADVNRLSLDWIKQAGRLADPVSVTFEGRTVRSELRTDQHLIVG